MASEGEVLEAVRRTRAFGIVRASLLQADFAGLDPGIDAASSPDVYDADGELIVARARLWMDASQLALVVSDLWRERHGGAIETEALGRWCRRVLLRWRSQPESARARDVALVAHAGQLDRAGRPYVGHPERVARDQRSDVAKAVAWLHDVVEDTVVSIGDLAEGGFQHRVVEAVDALTHREGEPYLDYVRRAGRNPLARLVKISDLRDNMDLTRLDGLPDDVRAAGLERVERKYRPALELLLGTGG